MTWIPSLNLSLINNPPTNSGSYSVHKMMLRKEPLGWMECFTFLWKTALCWLNFLCTGSLDFRSIVLDKSNAMFETWKTKFTFCFYGIILSQQNSFININFYHIGIKVTKYALKVQTLNIWMTFPGSWVWRDLYQGGTEKEEEHINKYPVCTLSILQLKTNLREVWSFIVSTYVMARWLSPLEHNV